MSWRGPVAISIVLFVSFLWGYKREMFSGAISNPPKSQPLTPTEPAQVAKPSAVPTGIITQVANPTPVAKIPSIVVPKTVEEPESEPAPPVEYTQPHNPYEELSRKLKEQQANNTESMAETFGSIRRDKIDEAQALQKNAYFRKLSEQLKELQGQAPPVTPPSDASQSAPNGSDQNHNAATSPSAVPTPSNLPGLGGGVSPGQSPGGPIPDGRPPSEPPPDIAGGNIYPTPFVAQDDPAPAPEYDSTNEVEDLEVEQEEIEIPPDEDL